MIIRKNNAFLLIEVLVTVLVVSVSIVLINQAFSSSLKAAGLASDYLNAVLLLEDKSFEYELNPSILAADNSGEEELAEGKFYWKQEILPFDEEDLAEEYSEEDIRLKKLKLSLEWERRNVRRQVEILTYAIYEEPQE
ncbi:MAG: hypothetical protein ABH843_02440 [Candidatus Omnitrophota bacterium]